MVWISIAHFAGRPKILPGARNLYHNDCYHDYPARTWSRLLVYVQCSKRRMPTPLPPGLKPLPLLGNVTDLLRSQQWVTFAKWGEIYGA